MRNRAHGNLRQIGFAASFYKRDISRAWYVAQACEYGMYVSIPAVISYGLPEESVERRMVRVESKIRSVQCHDTGKPLRLRSSRISAL